MTPQCGGTPHSKARYGHDAGAQRACDAAARKPTKYVHGYGARGGRGVLTRWRVRFARGAPAGSSTRDSEGEHVSASRSRPRLPRARDAP
jgi:hypothetical protein